MISIRSSPYTCSGTVLMTKFFQGWGANSQSSHLLLLNQYLDLGGEGLFIGEYPLPHVLRTCKLHMIGFPCGIICGETSLNFCHSL